MCTCIYISYHKIYAIFYWHPFRGDHMISSWIMNVLASPWLRSSSCPLVLLPAVTMVLVFLLHPPLAWQRPTRDWRCPPQRRNFQGIGFKTLNSTCMNAPISWCSFGRGKGVYYNIAVCMFQLPLQGETTFKKKHCTTLWRKTDPLSPSWNVQTGQHFRAEDFFKRNTKKKKQSKQFQKTCPRVTKTQGKIQLLFTNCQILRSSQT